MRLGRPRNRDMPDIGSVKAKTAIDWYEGGMSILELAEIHDVTTYIATKFLHERSSFANVAGHPLLSNQHNTKE